jgi:hypothetical protein
MAPVKEKALMFLSMAAILAGGLLIHTSFSEYNAFPFALAGILLAAGGLTHVWMRSSFYRKRFKLTHYRF